MSTAEQYFTELAGNPEERKSLNDGIAEDIVAHAKSKGYDISAEDVEAILAKKMGGSSNLLGVSIGWS